MATFKDLSLSQELLDGLTRLGFTVPTEIQEKTIPLLLSTSKIDFHGQAQTGTGKTLAFGIPLLERIDKQHKSPQAMIVAPTRELAVQIYESLQKIANHMGVRTAVLYGGVSIDQQIAQLKKGAHIIVGTPGRIQDHIRRKSLDPRTIKNLVLDEADIMLDMGFKDEIEEILRILPADRQIWLFSATVKSGIAQIMKKHMKETVSVRITPTAVSAARTKQYYCIVPFKSRTHAIARFIQATEGFYGFIFCQTKILASEVADELTKRGYAVAALHGDLTQQQRNRVIRKFRAGEQTILVCTDVAARGIDIPDITHVINYTIPDDLEGYVHRVGRTGRAGKEGVAITFISKTEQRLIKQIERRFGIVIEPIDVPSVKDVIEKRLSEIPAYVAELSKQPVSQKAEIESFLRGLSAEQMKELTAHLLSDKFLSKIDSEDIPYVHVEDEGQFQEIGISMGSEDGITTEDVRRFVLSSPVVTSDQIMKIRVIKHRTYIKLSSECSPDLVSSLRGQLLNGRKVQINVICLVSEKQSPYQQWNRPDRSKSRKNRNYGKKRT